MSVQSNHLSDFVRDFVSSSRSDFSSFFNSSQVFVNEESLGVSTCITNSFLTCIFKPGKGMRLCIVLMTTVLCLTKCKLNIGPVKLS